MKNLSVLALLLVCAVFAEHDSSSSSEEEEDTICDTELKRIRTVVLKTVNDDTFKFLNVHRKFTELNEGTITEDDFNTFIDDYCPKAIIAVHSAFEHIPTVSEECKTNEKLEMKHNLIRFYDGLLGQLCKDDAKGYKDLIKNDGVKCFKDNADLNECWGTHGMTYMDMNNYKDENICKFVQVMMECSEHLDKCDNPDVKTISTEIHPILNEKLNCVAN